MVKYNLIIKTPNNGKIFFNDMPMKILIKNIVENLKNIYNIDIKKLNNQIIYNIINKRAVNPILAEFIEINRVNNIYKIDKIDKKKIETLETLETLENKNNLNSLCDKCIRSYENCYC